MAGKCFVATLLPMTKGATDGGGIIADQVQSDGGGKPPQHSTTLTASPPFDVSLYLSRMSRPVCSIVAMTVSRLTTCVPSPIIAMRLASIALIAPIAFRSMHGLWTRPPTGSQVRPRVCHMPELQGVGVGTRW